jgi:hypothetical protein
MTPTSRRGSCTTGETSTAPRSSVRRQRATVSSVTASCSGWPGASSSARAAASSSTCSMSKRDAVIACGDRAAPDRAQLRRDVRDLKAGAFAPTDLAAQPRERRQERALDVVRLQAPRTRLVHQRAQLGDVRVLQRVGDERALGHQLLDPTSDARVDDLLHVRPRLGQPAVADRLDQQRAQRGLAERRAERVEHLAAVGLTLLLDLRQQPHEDLALTVLSATSSRGGSPPAGRCGGCGRTVARCGSGSTAGRS